MAACPLTWHPPSAGRPYQRVCCSPDSVSPLGRESWGASPPVTPPPLLLPQMYGRYTQDLGTFAKDEAARLRLQQGHGEGDTPRPRRPSELLEYTQGRCAPCRGKGHGG